MCRIVYFVFFFFFKQKTAYEMRISDWSSDVCSSDLEHRGDPVRVSQHAEVEVDLGALQDGPAEGQRCQRGDGRGEQAGPHQAASVDGGCPAALLPPTSPLAAHMRQAGDNRREWSRARGRQ